MLRNRARNPRDLRLLFKSLNRLRNIRESRLSKIGSSTSLPSFLKSTSSSGKKRFSSTGNIENEFGSTVQLFEQVSGSNFPLCPAQSAAASFDKRSSKKSSSSILNAVNRFDAIISSKDCLSTTDLFLLRKLTASLLWGGSSSDRAQKEALAWLRHINRQQPHLLKLLTPHAWKLFWEPEKNLTFPSHRSVFLGNVMQKAGVKMTEEQEIGYIGGLYWNESSEQAIESWEDMIVRSGDSPPAWNLGVRLFSLEQDPKKAQQVISRMISKLGYTEHSMWVPVIMAYNHIHDPETAWNAYKKMLECAKKNSTKITAQQFDDLSMSFLDNYQPMMGLKVYKQMVYEGYKSIDRQQTLVYQNLQVAIDAAQKQTVDPETLNNLSVDALQTLPPSVTNKYFYGGWMLNLMRMGRTDLAWFLVRDVMNSRETPPDSVHLNWVIQGFLGEGNIKMAEAIAQEMIQEQLRKHSKKLHNSIMSESRIRKDETKDNPKEPPIAPATVQTFSILILYNARRRRMDRVASLCSQMMECGIRPNSYIMNHLLYSLYRTHDLSRLARTFQAMIAEAEVKPDFESLLVMWSAMWRHHTQSHRRTSKFLTPRALFKLTNEHLPPRTEEDSGKMLDVWYSIIKSFLLSRDLAGTLLALHGGCKLWGMQVDETVVMEVAFGVLRARPWDPEKTGGERPRVNASTIVASVDNLKRLGESIVRAKRNRRGLTGVKLKQLQEKVRVDEGSLESLTILIRKELGSSSLVIDDLERAQADMGLSNVEFPEVYM